jgi:hypothetical protein
MSTETRRTVRLPMVIPVEITYTDQNGQQVLERTETKDIDRQGARLTTRAYHPDGSKIRLSIPHMGRSAHTRVVWCSAPMNGTYEIGLEMEVTEDVWGVPFTPSNWTAGMDPASTLWTLARMLEEKGVITREELRARVTGSARQSSPDEAVAAPWMSHWV